MDVEERLRLHVEYSLKRDAIARRAVQLLDRGRVEEGLEAAEEAELWALEAMVLETQ